MGYHAPPKVSESEKLSDFALTKQNQEQSQPQRSNCEKVPCCQFKIEGEAFMIAHDEEESQTIQQALSNPTSKELIKAMEEVMNSMKSKPSLGFC